jgi:ribose 5-phosphate isomerase B
MTDKHGKNCIFIGSDHHGFEYKKAIMKYIMKNHSDRGFFDLGTHTNEFKDYPDVVKRLKRDLSLEMMQDIDYTQPLAILICNSGMGMCMAVNKLKGIRAAVCKTGKDLLNAIMHNNINVLCISAHDTELDMVLCMVKHYFKQSYVPVERHSRRIEKLNNI